MSLFILDFEKISNARTREYFREVVSSYNNGNYRSSVVVLYSVCVCDIVFKLVDLSELYGDKNAEEILKRYRSKFNMGDKTASKSAWEKELINEVCEKGLIETVTKERLTNLYSLRNMAAHPILGQNYELYNPTKEESVALILAMYDSLLTQPSLFMTSIVEMLSEDIARNRDTFRVNQDQFETYIRKKYFDHLNKKYLQQVFRSFWKFCFVLENDECDLYRNINIQLLAFLIRTEKDSCILAIREDREKFGCSLAPQCQKALVEFLARFPFLYEELSDLAHKNIKAFIERNDSKVISWFLFDTPEEFVDTLEKRWRVQSLCTEYKELFEQYFEGYGKVSLMYDFYIHLFKNSGTFYNSSCIWNWLLKDKIRLLTNSQLEALVEAVNTNGQIYHNWDLGDFCRRIETEYINRKVDFDFAKYPNFRCSKTS